MSLADFIGSPDVAGWLADLARQIRERVERWPGPGDGPGDDDPELRCVLELADGGWGVYGVGALSVGVEPTPRPALYLDPAWLVRDLRRLDLGVPWVEVERAETLGPPVSWQGTDGFLTAGHVTGAKGTSVTVMDPTRARLPASVVEQVLPGAFPPPPGSPVGDLDVAIVTIGGTTPSALGLGGPGTAKPKDPATKTRGAGVANSTTGEINSFSPWIGGPRGFWADCFGVFDPQRGTFADRGDSGAGVTAAGNVIGIVVAGARATPGCGGAVSFVQSIKTIIGACAAPCTPTPEREPP